MIQSEAPRHPAPSTAVTPRAAGRPRSGASLNPASSNYYSHRVFMVFQTDDYREYFEKIVGRGTGWQNEEQARYWTSRGTLLVYRARMDPFVFNECLNRYIDDEGKFRVDEDGRLRDGYKPEMFRMQLTMQLALEAITRRANIEGQIDENPAAATRLLTSCRGGTVRCSRNIARQ